MKLIDAYSEILKLKQPVVRTDDVALLLNITNDYASKLLKRLAESGHISHITRGLWAIQKNSDITSLCQYITSPMPNYISLQSALYRYGIISQIPAILYLVSIGRSRTVRTPLGTISVHHINPSFFFGYVKDTSDGVFIATPEKALIDFLYLSPAKSGLFHSLPEIEFPENFNIHRTESIILRIPSKQRRTMVARRFLSLLKTR